MISALTYELGQMRKEAMAEICKRPGRLKTLETFGNMAQIEEAGVRVGDTIVSRYYYVKVPPTWLESRLTLVWLGKCLPVWEVWERFGGAPWDKPEWSFKGEYTHWKLFGQKWFRWHDGD